jgi:hypothetical protein
LLLKNGFMKTTRVLIIVVLVIVIIPLIGYAGWMLKKGESLEVFVVNKSLTHYRGSENRAMNAVLTRQKVLTSGNRLYNLKVDHYGLLWNKGDYTVKFPRLNELDRAAEISDMVYYADASGIMTSDIRSLGEGEKDQVEYGGLNNTDYTFIRKLITLNKPLVVECSFMGPPTEPLVRYNLEQMTDVYYVGWLGTYVKDLAGEPDHRGGVDWKKLYKDYTGNDWAFSGPGLIMINADAGRILVLEEGSEIQTSGGLIVSTGHAMDEYGIPESVNYTGWFTLLHPGRNEVCSEFRLNPTEEGKLLLNEFGIPESFPALIHAEDNLWFLAGDFGKCKSNRVVPRLWAVGPLLERINGNSKQASNFFYTYYMPFMRTVIEDAREMKSEG